MTSDPRGLVELTRPWPETARTASSPEIPASTPDGIVASRLHAPRTPGAAGGRVRGEGRAVATSGDERASLSTRRAPWSGSPGAGPCTMCVDLPRREHEARGPRGLRRAPRRPIYRPAVLPSIYFREAGGCCSRSYATAGPASPSTRPRRAGPGGQAAPAVRGATASGSRRASPRSTPGAPAGRGGRHQRAGRPDERADRRRPPGPRARARAAPSGQGVSTGGGRLSPDIEELASRSSSATCGAARGWRPQRPFDRGDGDHRDAAGGRPARVARPRRPRGRGDARRGREVLIAVSGLAGGPGAWSALEPAKPILAEHEARCRRRRDLTEAAHRPTDPRNERAKDPEPG